MQTHQNRKLSYTCRYYLSFMCSSVRRAVQDARPRGHARSPSGRPAGTCWSSSACELCTGPSRRADCTESGAGLCPCTLWRKCSPQPACNGSAAAWSCTRASAPCGWRRWPRPWTRGAARGCEPSGSWTWRGTPCWSPRSSCRASRRSRRRPRRPPPAGALSAPGPPARASTPRCLQTGKERRWSWGRKWKQAVKRNAPTVKNAVRCQRDGRARAIPVSHACYFTFLFH